MRTCTTVSQNNRHLKAGLGGAPPLGVVLALVLFAVAAPAQAASPRENEAAKLFFEGRYPDALRIYVDLAVATGDPAYVCEIGRCYSRMGKPEEASRNLRDCLSQAKLPPKKKREFQALQVEVDAARAAAAAPTTPPAATPLPGYPPSAPPAWGQPGAGAPVRPPTQGPPGGYPPPQGYGQAPPPGYGAAPPPGVYPGGPPPGQPGYPPPNPAGGPIAQGPAGGPPPGGNWGQPPAAANPPGAGQPADNTLSANADAGASDKAWMKPTAYVAGSVGVLSAIGGAVAGLMAKQKFNDVAKEYNDAKYKNGKTYNMIQYIGYGVGAAGIGTAVVLFLLAPSSSGTQVAGGLNLVASPESVGIAGTF